MDDRSSSQSLYLQKDITKEDRIRVTGDCSWMWGERLGSLDDASTRDPWPISAVSITTTLPMYLHMCHDNSELILRVPMSYLWILISHMFHVLGVWHTEWGDVDPPYSSSLSVIGNLAKTFPTLQLRMFRNIPWFQWLSQLHLWTPAQISSLFGCDSMLGLKWLLILISVPRTIRSKYISLVPRWYRGQSWRDGADCTLRSSFMDQYMSYAKDLLVYSIE